MSGKGLRIRTLSKIGNEVIRSSFISQVLKNKYVPKQNNTSSSTAHADVDEVWMTEDSSTHSIFQQRSARSSSDEEVFNYHDRLLLSKNHKLSSSSQSKESLNKGDKSESLKESPRIISQSAITNNMTVQGMTPSVKVGLSALENSYQNIKHKTPINETRTLRKSGIKSSGSASGANALAEDYIKHVNFAATKIQRWFRRHHMRRKSGEAAIQRLLSSKKQLIEEQRLRESQNDFLAKEIEERKLEERRRIREEKAKHARQQAIQVSFS